MFKRKYTVSILNSKWELVKINIKMSLVPRTDELIFLDGQYYRVINIVHLLNGKHGIFLIINEL